MSVILRYLDNNGNVAWRYWVDHDLMVGGSILNEEDWKCLKRMGCSAVLSVESQSSREDTWVDVPRLHRPFLDDGNLVAPEIIEDCLDFAARFRHGKFDSPYGRGFTYLHCALGGSRSPSIAYAIMRSRGRSVDEAVECLRKGRPDFMDSNRHIVGAYVESIEGVLKKRGVS